MRGCSFRSTVQFICLGAFMTTLSIPTFADSPRAALPPAERARLMRVLTDALSRRDFVGVHAAEALIAVGLPEPALKAFEPQVDTTEPKYRIGVWRVLARAETDPARRVPIVERVRAVLFDERAIDRVHAMETLAKLNVPVANDAERRAVETMAKDPQAGPFALWRFALTGDAVAMDGLAAFARGDDVIGRARAEYVLTHLGATDKPQAVAGKGNEAEQRERLERQLADPDEDVRVTAALGLLRMDDATRPAPTTRPKG
jgi:SSS family solute:Na+ symporter